jgi:PhnB protein
VYFQDGQYQLENERRATMELNPYLTFNGQCEAAFKFYEHLLGGKIEFILTYRGSPMADQVPSEWQDKILHATLVVGDKVLQGADSSPEHREEMKGFAVTIGLEDPVEAERIFRAFAEKGTVQMPLQETFWALRFAMLVDEFGVPWMINCSKPA